MDVALNVSSLDFTSGLAEYLRGGHVLWAYGLLAATTAPPLVPNSVLLVTGGVMAAEGHLNLALVLLVVAGSAVLGDLVMHRTGGRSAAGCWPACIAGPAARRSCAGRRCAYSGTACPS